MFAYISAPKMQQLPLPYQVTFLHKLNWVQKGNGAITFYPSILCVDFSTYIQLKFVRRQFNAGLLYNVHNMQETPSFFFIIYFYIASFHFVIIY